MWLCAQRTFAFYIRPAFIITDAHPHPHPNPKQMRTPTSPPSAPNRVRSSLDIGAARHLDLYDARSAQTLWPASDAAIHTASACRL
ncbi:hypothetical protein B0H17DRAFT_1223171 [Mycena rosella]|uniref:Uncharacterized protein n=1 Tax=Mycena rosella TaxID=1033263 RepID=A0AAD7F577_MYCRO|nr:hypothetical protein B0H17DRAFT_1223171 [Mycena rosella]